MKRQIALEGDRKWYSDHMVELQSEALAAIDKIASYFGACALAGGEAYEVDTVNNQNKFTEAMVVLYVTEEAKWMVMPLPDNGFIGNYSQGRWIVAQKQDVMGEYRLGSDVIAHNYTAKFVLSSPAGAADTYIYVPGNSARVPDLLQMLSNKNLTRSLFAAANHSHDKITSKSSGYDDFVDGLYCGDNDGIFINIGKTAGIDFNNQFHQLKFAYNGIQIRSSFLSVGGPTWTNWSYITKSKGSIAATRGSDISAANYRARATSSNGLATVNLFASIASESNVNIPLITLSNAAPVSEIRILQPLVSNSDYSHVTYRDLYISPSGDDAIIRMDTDLLVNYSFSLNLTYEMV